MNQNAPHRDFTRKNFGEMQNFLVLGVLCLFIASIIAGLLNNIVVNSKIDGLGDTEFPFSSAYVENIREMESKPLKATIETGEYVYQVEYGNSPIVGGRIRLLEDQKITRTLTVDHASRMYATADYRIVGSVLKYENVKGDKYLFPSAGNPLYEDSNKVTLELDGHLGIQLMRQGTSPNYTGVIEIPDNRTIFGKLSGLHPYNLLQKLFTALAIVLMGYILVRINFKPDSPKRSGPKNTFEA